MGDIAVAGGIASVVEPFGWGGLKVVVFGVLNRQVVAIFFGVGGF